MNIKKYITVYIFSFLVYFLFLQNVYSSAEIDIISKLTLPKGFSISVYCWGMFNPWMMAIDREGTLFVTIPKRGSVIALPDKDNDGKADAIKNIILDLNHPSGIAIFNDKLYVANAKTIIKATYDPIYLEELRDYEIIYNKFPDFQDEAWFRTLKFGPDKKMFISIGAPCNVCKPRDNWQASIIQFDEDTKKERIYADGLRNSVGITFNPKTRYLWAVDSAREGLKENAPDEINLILEGKFYGWPYCYGDNVIDPAHNNRNICKSAVKPQIKLPPDSSPYGLAFYTANLFPREYQGDLFVALYGKEKSNNGFKIVRILFENNKPIKIMDFITGWLSPTGDILGRPTDIIFNNKGEMFISDSYNGIIYKVTYNK